MDDPDPAPPFNVKAIAAFAARNDIELTLEIGKIYTVVQTDGKGLWWQAWQGENLCWFPASYVEICDEPKPAAVPSVPKGKELPPPPDKSQVEKADDDGFDGNGFVTLQSARLVPSLSHLLFHRGLLAHFSWPGNV